MSWSVALYSMKTAQSQSKTNLCWAVRDTPELNREMFEATVLTHKLMQL